MLFDPKIKHNGKIRNIQFFDPSKVTLKDFDTIKNNFKPGDSLLVNENDSITEAIAKIEESLHPSIKDDTVLRLDIESMRKLYPDNVNGGSSLFPYKISIMSPFDGMKILFNRQLDDVRDYESKSNNSSSTVTGTVTIIYKSTVEGKEFWNSYIIDNRQLSNNNSKVILINEFMPLTFGDYEQSEFQHDYLILDPYVVGTNYISIYKTNLKEIEIFTNTARTVY